MMLRSIRLLTLIVALALLSVYLLSGPGLALQANTEAESLSSSPNLTATVAAGSGEVGVGAIITVPLTISLASHTFGAATIDVQYDSSVLTAVTCSSDPNNALDFKSCRPTYKANTVRFTGISSAGLSGDLLLAEIGFQAVGQAGEESALALTTKTLSDPNGTSIAVNEQDGLITLVTPSLSINDVTVDEGAGTAILTATLSTVTSLPVSVDYTTVNGTASAGSDYTTTTGTLTITANSASGTIAVPINDDALDENDEMFTMTLSNPTNATIVDHEGMSTITDNDDTPSLSIKDVTVSEGTGTATLTVTLSAVSGLPASVDYTTSNGTASAGSDYTTTTGTLTIPAGAASGSVSVNINDDALDENDESLTVDLSNPTNATIADNQGTVTITDNDASQSLSIKDVTVSEGASTATLTVTLSAVSGLPASVDYTTSNGTASAGSDYTTTTGTLTIPAGAASGSVSVNINDDALDENDESLTVDLSNPTNATIADNQGTVTITDNDASQSLSIKDVTVSEGASTATLTVTLSAVSGLPASVDYTTNNGTASAGSDYTAISGTLTIPAGAASGSVTVNISEDALDENDESLTVDLSNPTNATIADNQGTVTITDNDDEPTVGFSSASYSINEDGGTASITVNLSAASGKTVIVEYATSHGTTTGNDYTTTSGTLTFSASDTSDTFSVTINDDAYDEEHETVNLTLSNGSNATLGTSDATLTILDNDFTAPTQVAISGATTGLLSQTHPFTATTSPISATTPITYVWQTSEHTAVTQNSDTQDSRSFTFSKMGRKTITVTASNLVGQVLATYQFFAVTHGNVSCDTTGDVVDALFILQYVVGTRIANDDCPLPEGTLYLPGCDVNNDNQCNVVDALFVLQCEVGVNNILCPAHTNTSLRLVADRPTGTLYIGSANETSDGGLTVPIMSNLNSQLGAATIDLHYDPTQLVLTGCKVDSTDAFDFSQCNPEFHSGTVRLTGISAAGLSGELLLAEITFEAVGDKPITAIDDLLTLNGVTFSDLAGEPIDVTGPKGQAGERIYLPIIQK